jgi:site-specific DNA-methyltransferase (adenine-specific)
VGKNILYKGDCLIESDKIESGSVDLILTDLPYGTVKGAQLDGWNGTKTDWDEVIDTNEIYKIANRILRKNGKMVLFAQEPFTTELINKAIPNIPFSYRMIWKKDHFANALIAKKAPVSYFEDVLVFTKEYDVENLHPLRSYASDVMKFIGLKLKEINTKLGHRKAEHFFYLKSTQFEICTEQVYDELIEAFGIDRMNNFKTYEQLKIENQKYEPIFNLWEGGKFKSNVLEYKKDYVGLHPTQKPVLLLEDLIKTFSNEGDLVVDLTMGSGSTGVACKNTNRDFIGIEMSEQYFNIAEKRINGTEFKPNGFEKTEEHGLLF